MTESHTDDALKRLRSEVAELRAEVNVRDSDIRFTVMTTALAAIMLALTAAPWFWRDFDRTSDQAETAWKMFAAGIIGPVTVLLVLVTAGVTVIYAGISAPTARAHWILCVLSLVCAGMLILLTSTAQDDESSGSGLWLTVIAALVLFAMHGTQGDRLRGRESRPRRR